MPSEAKSGLKSRNKFQVFLCKFFCSLFFLVSIIDKADKTKLFQFCTKDWFMTNLIFNFQFFILKPYWINVCSYVKFLLFVCYFHTEQKPRQQLQWQGSTRKKSKMLCKINIFFCQKHNNSTKRDHATTR